MQYSKRNLKISSNKLNPTMLSYKTFQNVSERLFESDPNKVLFSQKVNIIRRENICFMSSNISFRMLDGHKGKVG